MQKPTLESRLFVGSKVFSLESLLFPRNLTTSNFSQRHCQNGWDAERSGQVDNAARPMECQRCVTHAAAFYHVNWRNSATSKARVQFVLRRVTLFWRNACAALSSSQTMFSLPVPAPERIASDTHQVPAVVECNGVKFGR